MLLWQVAIVCMAVDVYGLTHLFATNSPSHQSWTTFQSVMYNCFSKTLWSLSLGWVIFSCHKGYGGGFVTSFSRYLFDIFFFRFDQQLFVLESLDTTVKIDLCCLPNPPNSPTNCARKLHIHNQVYQLLLVRIVHWLGFLYIWCSLCPFYLC